MTHAEKEIRNEEMREFKAKGHTMQEVADKFGTSLGTATRICKGIAPQKYIPKPHEGRKSTDEEVALFIASKTDRFRYAGNYTGADGRADVQCLTCGTIFNRSMISIRKNHFGCPHCRELKSQEYKERKRHEDFKTNKARKEREAKSFHNSNQLGFYVGVCQECGHTFISYRQNVKFCSDICSKKQLWGRAETKRRLMIQDAMIDKDISLQRLFERDDGMCALCGAECDWNNFEMKDGTFIAGNFYPSIDHIIPLSKGGLHSWGNVQLAHRICNSYKHNKTV